MLPDDWIFSFKILIWYPHQAEKKSSDTQRVPTRYPLGITRSFYKKNVRPTSLLCYVMLSTTTQEGQAHYRKEADDTSTWTSVAYFPKSRAFPVWIDPLGMRGFWGDGFGTSMEVSVLYMESLVFLNFFNNGLNFPDI